MSSGPSFVLDNNVLSGARLAGWFGSLEFWENDAALLVPARVWQQEFQASSHRVEESPEWLHIREAELQELDVSAQGQLSVQDWACIAMAEKESAHVVTNDKPLYSRFEDRGGESIWGTKFLKRTFERCGISVTSFNDGVDEYIEDAYLPDRVAEFLRESEKDD
jgi:rRNA-processing protein FCF1